MQTYRLNQTHDLHSSARPHIRRNIDGPLLVFRDGQMHWLTWRERMACWLGLTDADRLEKKRRPDLATTDRSANEPT